MGRLNACKLPEVEVLVISVSVTRGCLGMSIVQEMPITLSGGVMTLKEDKL